MSYILIDEEKLNLSEKLLDVLGKVENIKLKIYNELEKRYQFNLHKTIDNHITSFNGKELFFYESLNTDNFYFRPQYVIRREVYNLLQNYIKENVILTPASITLTYKKDKDLKPYNSISIYDKIELNGRTDHIKVVAKFDNIIVNIPPLGASIDGLPFFEDKIPDEANTSGWWIEGNSVKFFVNTFANKEVKMVKIIVYYELY